MAAEVQTVVTDAVAEAHDLVERLYSTEQELSRRLLKLREDLPAAQSAGGADLLKAALSGAATPKGATSRLVQIRTEIEVVEDAIAQARSQRVEAIKLLWRAEAEPLRKRAVELRKEADEREIKTAAMLRELEEWEQCEYAPASPHRPHTAPRHDDSPRTAPILSPEGGIIPSYPPNPVGDLQVVIVPTPKTQLLRNEAAELERQAEALESRQVTTHGFASAPNRDELLADLAARGPMVLVPELGAVLEYLDRLEAKVRARRQEIIRRGTAHGFTPVEAPVPVSLSWRDGEIYEEPASRLISQEAW